MKKETIHKFLDLGLDLILLKKDDKRPASPWKEPEHHSLDRLLKWKGNYGAALGQRSNNIVVVDLDQKQLYQFFKNVKTLVVETPNRGYHIYLKSKKSQAKVPSFMFKPIDVQGNGSYVVVPPSKINNKEYKIIKDEPILEVTDVEKFITKQLSSIIFNKTVNCKEAVKEYLGEPLQDFGKYVQYNCPFHSDVDSPSFTVYEDGMKCFGCGWSGTFEMFLQKKEGKSPVEVKKLLEDKGYSAGDDLEFGIETKKEKQIRLLSEQLDKDFNIVRDVETEDLFLYVDSYNMYVELTPLMLGKLIFEEYGQRVSIGDCKKIMDYFVVNVRKEDKDWISFNNLLVNIETLETKKPNPDIFTKYHFDYDWNPHSYSEPFDTVLKQILIGDDGKEDKYNLFFEMFGYLFTNHNRLTKMFFITGEGGNGKSTLMDLIEIVFKKYKCSVPFHEMANPFGKQTMLHKLVNVLPDLSNKSLSDTSDIKAITGGDSVAIDRKYKETKNMVLPIKFVATGNYLPKTSESGYAFFRRVIHVELTNTFKDQVSNDDDKKAEDVRKWLPYDTQGIEWLIFKSFEAYNRVKEEGWSVQKDISEVQDQYIKLSNPVLWVAKRMFKKDPTYDNFYTRQDVIRWFKQELRKYGLKEPGNNSIYYETIRDIGGDDSKQTVFNKQERGFVGVVRTMGDDGIIDLDEEL